MSRDAKKAALLRKPREKRYGKPEVGFAALGLAWAGLLTDHFQRPIAPIPAHVVALMMASLKLQRAAKPLKASADDIHDGLNYLACARETDPRHKKGGRRAPRA